MDENGISVYMEKVKCPLFHAYYDIIVGFDTDTIKEQIRDCYPGINLDSQLTNSTLGYAFSVQHPDHGLGFTLVFNLGAQNWEGNPGLDSTIVHECCHLSWFIMDGVGVKVDGDNHEVQCYLIEDFQRQAKRVIKIAKGKKPLDSL